MKILRIILERTRSLIRELNIGHVMAFVCVSLALLNLPSALDGSWFNWLAMAFCLLIGIVNIRIGNSLK